MTSDLVGWLAVV